MINVSIIQLGREIVTYTLEDESTVSDLLEIDGREYNEGELTVCQRAVGEDTVLRDGDRVVISKVVKGNVDPFEVEIHQLGGRTFTLPATDGMTIGQVIGQLESENRSRFFKADGKPAYEFRIVETGSQTKVASSMDYILARPASGKLRIICAQMTKGN